MDNIAVQVENVSKNFRLPHDKTDSIKSIFTNLSTYITKRRTYEVQHALRGVSIEVKKGEFFGIVGRNGSGKSTLLKILAGIYQPTKGTVKIQGKLVPFIELGVGFNPELTGRDNVFLNGAVLGFTHKEVEAMYDDIVSFAELEQFMDQKLKNYSSGMQVRLAFSMATRANTDILLIDEVLAVGDADFQRKCFSFFKELKRKKKTIIFVSHDMNSIREYCDRAILINDSKVVCEGNPIKVSSEYSKLFLGKDKQNTGDDGEDRWGNKSAKIIQPIVNVSQEKIEINCTIKANKPIDGLIIGYVISNEVGQQLTGSNTRIIGEKIEKLAEKEERSISFVIDNVFGDGIYDVTLAVLADSGATTVDWWVNATRFIVKRAQHTPYLVDIPVGLIVKEKD